MVRFNPKARLDRSRIRDVGNGGGGVGGGSGMRIPIPGGLGGKGGLGGLLLVIALVILAKCAGVDIDPFGDSAVYSPSRLDDAQDSGRYDHCETGEDANEAHDCARVAVENSLTDYWDSGLGRKFRPEDALITFTGSVNTGCGGADSSVGPSTAPATRRSTSIRPSSTRCSRISSADPDGGFVEFYVLAHEYGHHISNLLGFMDQVTNQGTGPTSPDVRLELQADCYAGLWANHATTDRGRLR